MATTHPTNDNDADTYEIVIAVPGPYYGRPAGNWDAEAPGWDNEFIDVEAAEAAIAELRMLDDYRDATFAIRRIGDRYPIPSTIDEPETDA